jgi:nifR3 family TIM-barrel protein
MRIGNLTIAGQALLAPMAGITDVVFRRLCRRFGAAIVYSEFLSSDGLLFNTMSQEHKLALADDEHPVAYQLFGARVQTFGRAAQMLSAYKPDLIDLNFGCPVRKVVGKNGGASLLKDLDLLASLVKETVDAVPLPVTVKMRAGWDDKTLVHCEAAARAVDAGALAVTLHARTRADGAWGPKYAGPAKWEYIAELKRHESRVPVIGNGDVTSPDTAKAMLDQTGCDAVMIGRAAVGRPWIFAEVNHFLATGERLPEPSAADVLTVAWHHIAEKIRVTPEPPAVVVRSLRKVLAAYIKGWPDSHTLRDHLMRIEDPEEIRRLFADYLAGHAGLSDNADSGWIDQYLPLDRGWIPKSRALVA